MFFNIKINIGIIVFSSHLVFLLNIFHWIDFKNFAGGTFKAAGAI